MTEAQYIETVQHGETRETLDVFIVWQPRTTTESFAAVDLSSPTGISPTLAHSVAVPVAAETQAAVADGRLVLA